jgi:DGQHR domain-containing protein
MKLSNASKTEVYQDIFRFTGQMDLRDLRGLTMVPRMGEVPQGYQRPLSKADVREIADMLHGGAELPGQISFVIPPEMEAGWERSSKALEFQATEEHRLEVLDGQHRTAGGFLHLEELEVAGKAATKTPIQVAIYMGINRVQAAAIFYEIHAKQRPVSRTHLAELAHMAGLEEGEALEASQIYDQLVAGPLAPVEGKKPKISRPAFIKAVVPLVVSSGVLGELSKEERARAVVGYFSALAEVVQGEVFKSAVVSAACDIYPDVAQRSAQQFSGIDQVSITAALQPLMGFQLKNLEKRGRGPVAAYFKSLVGFKVGPSWLGPEVD